MRERTIMIFPEFINHEVIDEIREKYDPLYHLVKPHITLVFPFQNEITDEELSRKLDKCLEEAVSFTLTLQGISRQKDSYGNYIFLDVKNGINEVTDIHKKLYTDIFGEQYNRKYVPHMTVGKLETVEKMEEVYASIKNMDICFETLVEKVCVERIGEHGESVIIIEKKLDRRKINSL